MFENILQQIDRYFVLEDQDISIDEWEDKVAALMPDFVKAVDPIFSVMKAFYPPRILQESKIEPVYSAEPMIRVCQVRLRPDNEYYIKQ